MSRRHSEDCLVNTSPGTDPEACTCGAEPRPSLAVEAGVYGAEMHAELTHLRSVRDELAYALSEAQDSLNGAPNTEGLHCQIDAALSSYNAAKTR